MSGAPRIVEIRRGVLAANDLLARRLRAEFLAAGVLAVNVVASPGSGKTALLEHLLRRTVPRSAAVVGDCATDNDARRLAASGARVRQITTAGLCHLEADLVSREIDGWDLGALDYLFIENVGNLVCTAAYDLGEQARLALLSVTEGEDKPHKYPQLFSTADVVAVTKCDLAEACGFDREAALSALRDVQPAAVVVETSARTGRGVDDLLAALAARRAAVPGV